MVTEMITLKLEKTFLDTVDSAVKTGGYQSRTEFIRNALREQLKKADIEKAIVEIAQLRGKSKKKISNEEYERVRREAFESLGSKKVLWPI